MIKIPNPFEEMLKEIEDTKNDISNVKNDISNNFSITISRFNAIQDFARSTNIKAGDILDITRKCFEDIRYTNGAIDRYNKILSDTNINIYNLNQLVKKIDNRIRYLGILIGINTLLVIYMLFFK